MNGMNEAKVGGFTVGALVLLVVIAMFLGRIDLFQKQSVNIVGEFGVVTGLKTGNAVRYSGVSVGRVTDMEVTPKGVTVYMDIEEGTEIPEDSSFSLAGDGLLGDRFIQIIPGKSTVMLKTGSTVHGEGRSALDKTAKSAEELLDEANKMLQAVNNIIGDKRTQDSVKHALQSAEGIMANTEAMIAENRRSMSEITANMAAITAQMNASLQNLDGDGRTTTHLRQMAEHMAGTTASVEHMARSLEGIVTDPESAGNIKETLHNAAQITTRINRITGGTAYGGSASATPTETIGADEPESDGPTDGMRTVRLDAGDGRESSDAGFRTDIRMGILYNDTSDDYSPEARIRVYLKENMFEFGASHIGDGSKLELNYGKRLAKRFWLRSGLFDGDVGVGLAYGLRKGGLLSAEVIDPNDVRYRLRGEVNVYGDTFAVLQWVRPYGAEYGGNYFGVSQKF